MWIKVESTKEIPVGKWLVYMEDGEYGYCEVNKIKSGTLAIVNGSFYFDRAKVIAYTSFNLYEGDKNV